MNFWHTGLNNQAPTVFDVSIFLGTSPCLHMLIGVFASTSPASLLHLPSPDQALPFNMAASRFRIRHGARQAIDVASGSSFHPADYQHTLDFRTRRSFTVVCHQQDQVFFYLSQMASASFLCLAFAFRRTHLSTAYICVLVISLLFLALLCRY